jgi:hypothetical protein
MDAATSMRTVVGTAEVGSSSRIAPGSVWRRTAYAANPHFAINAFKRVDRGPFMKGRREQ